MNQRERLIESIAGRILELTLAHPLRVGVDGITASGKSTFANELFQNLSNSGRHCILTTLDGFHNPKAIRHAKGRESAAGYYQDAYNYSQVLQNLLIPLGPDGNLYYRTRTHDLETDQPVRVPFDSAKSDSILIVDGSFALRRELRSHWDFGIYIQADFEVAQSRAAIRDTSSFGSSERALEVTIKRYHGAHRIHNELETPWLFADVVVDNNSPHNPRIIDARSTAENGHSA